MIKIEDIKKISQLVFMTGRIKKVKPISLMLVAGAGSGKTEIITSFKGKNIIQVTDLSYMGLIKAIEENPKIKHIIIPDFIKLTNKKGSTSANLISFLNNFLEEGINQIKLYNYNKDFKGKQGAIVTATTKASFSQHRRDWEGSGFMSRMIIVSYGYTKETLQKIQEFIASEESLKKQIYKISSTEKEIKSSFKFNSQFIKISKTDLRKQKQLQTLAKANALLNNRINVNQKDVDEILRLSKYMNEWFTKL